MPRFYCCHVFIHRSTINICFWKGKEKMKSILLAALIVFGVVGVFAQERTLTQAEFDSIIKNSKWAVPEWKGKPLRMIQTSEARAEGKFQEFSSGKTTIEFASPNVSRLRSEITSGSKTTKSESIRIGDKIYTRSGDQDWVEGTAQAKAQTKTAVPPPPPPSPVFEDQAEKLTEYKYLGTEQLNGLTANVYAVTTKIKRLNPTTNKETLSISTRKYWISKDGVKLKEEDIGETRAGETNLYRRLTVVWELDPTIKVEAPAIN
jgi:hypothetical protein